MYRLACFAALVLVLSRRSPHTGTQLSVDDAMARDALDEKTRGNEHYKGGRYAQAVQSYTNSLLIDPSSSVVYANRAMARLKLRQWAKAEEVCLEIFFVQTACTSSNNSLFIYAPETSLSERMHLKRWFSTRAVSRRFSAEQPRAPSWARRTPPPAISLPPSHLSPATAYVFSQLKNVASEFVFF